MEIPSIPPGFESFVPFTVKKAQNHQVVSYSSPTGAVEPRMIKMETESDCNNDSKTMKSLGRMPGIKFNQRENGSGDEWDSEQHMFPRPQLPKGVLRGCEACKNCQKVTAKWRPEEARRPDLEDAPVFYPSEEEFEDTLNYISTIRVKAEIYGICRIVPPPSWKPPCPLKERDIWESSKFATRVQRIDKLQNRNSMRKILQANHNKRKKKRRCMNSDVDNETGNEEINVTGEFGLYEAERFGFEPGPDFTLDAFQKYADEFKALYFCKNNTSSHSGSNSSIVEEQWQPSIENIEGEYWRMVEKPTEEIEVLYGADLETGIFGSGFPKNAQQVCSSSDTMYITSGWNLNNFPKFPGSVLSFESSDISGVLIPWLYIGMCLSSFCWHVEDHHLYSLNYMHWGAPKMWYGVPGSDALKLEAAMRKHLPDLFDEQPDLLHKLVTQLSPSILKSEGVHVYRCVQNPGEFVLTFPRAYHAGFNCGFNCAEAVNVAPVDWLPHGQNAIELYREQGRKTSISHDKLLLGAAREAVKANWEYNLLKKSTSNNLRWKDACGKDGVLSKALKARVELERTQREYLCKFSQALKMESTFDANSERECSICLFDLHLSATGCHHCSPDKYACLNHAKQLCSCSWGAKFFLFRYEINELNILVEALEGKLSAVYRWARLDLGLALSSCVSKHNKKGQVGKLPYISQGLPPKETSYLSTVISSKEQKGKADGFILNRKRYNDTTNSSPNLKPPVVVLALENIKAPSDLSVLKSEAAPRCKVSLGQLPQVNGLKSMATAEKLVSEKAERNQSSSPGKKDAVILDRDEAVGPTKKLSVEKETSTGGITSDLSSQKGEAAPCKASSGQLPQVNGVNSQPHAENLALEKAEWNQSFSLGSKDAIILDDDNEAVGPTKESSVEKEASTGGIEKPVCHENMASLGSCKNSSSSEGIKVEDDADCSRDVPLNESPSCGDANAGGLHRPQQIDDEQLCNGDGNKNVEVEVDSRSMDNLQSVSCNPSGSSNILDRYYRQKGPRIAKVVRRINCNVIPLDFGAVHAGKLWCDSRAIYPEGFRSRVRYIDVVDPSNMCYYVSEILDGGQNGPLFMVSVEHCPSEVFVHVLAARCWEMVRERVNQEITKQHKLGRGNLPPLQPPGSIDGMEMFGFSSPAIVQAIQALDKNRICTDYWKSRPLMQIPQQSRTIVTSCYSNVKAEHSDNDRNSENRHGIQRIINGLFDKADREELQTLHSLVCNKNHIECQILLTRLLNEAIQKHLR